MKRPLACCLSVALLNASLAEGWAAVKTEPASTAVPPGLEAPVPGLAAEPAPLGGASSAALQAAPAGLAPGASGDLRAPSLQPPAPAPAPAAVLPGAAVIPPAAVPRGPTEEESAARFRRAVGGYEDLYWDGTRKLPGLEAELGFAAEHALANPLAREVRDVVLDADLRERLGRGPKGGGEETAAAAAGLARALEGELDLPSARAAQDSGNQRFGAALFASMGIIFITETVALYANPMLSFIGWMLGIFGVASLAGAAVLLEDARKTAGASAAALEKARGYKSRARFSGSLRRERRKLLARLRRMPGAASEELLARLAVLQARLGKLGKDSAGLKTLARAAGAAAARLPAEGPVDYRTSAKGPRVGLRERVRVRVDEALESEGVELGAEERAALDEALAADEAAPPKKASR